MFDGMIDENTQGKHGVPLPRVVGATNMHGAPLPQVRGTFVSCLYDNKTM
jgi:hypothetical protein